MPTSLKASWSEDHFGFPLLGLNHLRAFLFFCALFVPATSLAAGYAFRFVVLADPSSPVRVLDAVGIRQAGVSYECLSFSNDANRPVTRVLFKFTYFDAAREMVGFDTLDRVGDVAAGATVTAPMVHDTRNLWHNPNCQHFQFPHEGIAINAVTVERVDFADGTSWTATPKNATPSPAPAN